MKLKGKVTRPVLGRFNVLNADVLLHGSGTVCTKSIMGNVPFSTVTLSILSLIGSTPPITFPPATFWEHFENMLKCGFTTVEPGDAGAERTGKTLSSLSHLFS